MKNSVVTKRTWRAVYRLLDRVSPIEGDCGELCGACCCLAGQQADRSGADAAEMGIYLLPGEEQLHHMPKMPCADDTAKKQVHDSSSTETPSCPAECVHSADHAADPMPDSWLKWNKIPARPFGFPESWGATVYFVQCTTPPHCPRKERPLQCRTYPLLPHLHEDGELELVYNDLELPYQCPLIEEEIPLEDRFVQATYTAWKHLIRDPRIRDLVWQDSRDRESAIRELGGKLEL